MQKETTAKLRHEMSQGAKEGDPFRMGLLIPIKM